MFEYDINLPKWPCPQSQKTQGLISNLFKNVPTPKVSCILSSWDQNLWNILKKKLNCNLLILQIKKKAKNMYYSQECSYSAHIVLMHHLHTGHFHPIERERLRTNEWVLLKALKPQSIKTAQPSILQAGRDENSVCASYYYYGNLQAMQKDEA